MAAPSDDDALAATMSPAAVDPSGATLASDQGTLASISGVSRATAGASAPDDAAALAPVDPAAYVRGKTLATGGMGRIVAAHDRRLGRPVALKEVRAASPELRRRFTREVKLTARLQHPNIITVHEAGTWPDGEPFFAMKLVAGRSLDKVVADKPTLEARLALLPAVIAVADALAYAHRERVIHRDLKPANVLVGDFGETVVIDWGLAKDLGAADEDEADEPDAPDARGPYRERPAGGDGETAFGAVIGTPAYMPPEQARGEQVDERADVYALGALLYHVLCGCPPVEAASLEEVLALVIAKPVIPPRARDARIPLELDTIIGKAMAPAAADRYPTAVELAEDLRRFQTGQLVGAHHYTTWQLVRRWIRRRRTPLAVAAVAVVVLAIGASVAVANIVAQRDRAETNAGTAASALRALLVDSGRREALEGHPLRALALYAEAMRRGEASPDLQFLVGQAAPFADTIRARFGDGVTNAAFTADDQHVLTAAHDGKVYVWDAETAAPIRSFEVPSPGKKVILGPSETLAVARDVLTPSSLAETEVWELAAGTRDARVADSFVYEDGGARVWLIGPFLAVTTPGRTYFAPNAWTRKVIGARAHGDELLLVSETELIRLRDAGTAIELVSRQPYRVDKPFAAVASADLDHVVIQSSGRLDFIDARAGVANTYETDFSGVVAIRGDGTQVAATTRHGTIQLLPWTASAGEDPDLLIPSREQVGDLDYSQDGGRLLVTDRVSSLFVLDTRSPAVVATLTAEVGITAAAISHDGTRVLAALVDGKAEMWDIAGARDLPAVSTGVRCAVYDAANHVVAVRESAFIREGKPDRLGDGTGSVGCVIDSTGHWIARSAARAILLYDLAAPAASAVTIAVGEDFGHVAIAPGGHRVAAIVAAGKIAVFDGSTRTATWPARAAQRTDRLEFSSDGAHLLVASTEGAHLDVIDTATGAVAAIDVPLLAVVRWAPDGSRVITGTTAGTVTVWDARTARPLLTLARHEAIEDVAVSRDDQLVLSACADGVVRAWDGRGALIRETRVTRARVEQLALAPGGQLFATFSSAHELAVWSAETGDQLADFGPWPYAASSLEFSRDGGRLLVVADSTVHQWDTRLEPRATAEVDALAARIPWAVRDGRVVPRK